MGVQRLGVDPYSTYSTYSKEPGDCGGSAAWRGFNAGQVARPGGFYAGQVARNFVAILRQQVNHGAILNQIVGGVQCRDSAGNPSIPGISLFRGGFPNGLYST